MARITIDEFRVFCDRCGGKIAKLQPAEEIDGKRYHVVCYERMEAAHDLAGAHPVPAGFRRMSAAYRGRCTVCHGDITPGMTIDYARDLGAQHAECSPACEPETPETAVIIEQPAVPATTTPEYGVGRVPADVDAVGETLAQIEAAQIMAQATTTSPTTPNSSAIIACPNCGMPTRRSLLMSASRGTACPACYDDQTE